MKSVVVLPDASALASSIAEHMTSRLAMIQTYGGGRPRVVLTGGTIANAAYAALEAGAVDWTNVDFYWGDERFVPEGHADRNDQQAKDAFLTRLGVPAEHIHAMPAHGCDLSTSEAATAYATELPTVPFDLVLLGMGPDGHVASLFPGFPHLRETERAVVEVLNSPKPPSVRLTMTFPALNNADAVWLLVSGEGKADAVARALGDGTVEDTPAAGVKGDTETVWLLDGPAASKLSR